MSIRSIAAIAAAVSASACFASSPFGAVANYNAVILNNMTSSNSDTEGRLAVGGNANLTNYAVGAALPSSNGTDNRLVVGGSLTFTNGQVNGGNARHAGTATTSGLTVTGGSLVQGASPFSFATVGQTLLNLSSGYAAMAATGATSVSSGALTLSGNKTGLNVFAVSSAQLASATSLTFSVPAGATVLVNVSGTSVSMQNFGFFLGSLNAAKILFNMVNATTLTMSGIGIEGSVLAPSAAVGFNNGQLNGQLFAKSFSGGGQLNNVLFSGQLNVIPLPPSVAMGAAGLVGVAFLRRRLRAR